MQQNTALCELGFGTPECPGRHDSEAGYRVLDLVRETVGYSPKTGRSDLFRVLMSLWWKVRTDLDGIQLITHLQEKDNVINAVYEGAAQWEERCRNAEEALLNIVMFRPGGNRYLVEEYRQKQLAAAFDRAIAHLKTYDHEQARHL